MLESCGPKHLEALDCLPLVQGMSKLDINLFLEIIRSCLWLWEINQYHAVLEEKCFFSWLFSNVNFKLFGAVVTGTSIFLSKIQSSLREPGICIDKSIHVALSFPPPCHVPNQNQVFLDPQATLEIALCQVCPFKQFFSPSKLDLLRKGFS